MNCELVTLESLVSIKTGAPMSRAKKIEKGEESLSVKVLIPAAMSAGRIDDGQLASELVSRVKNDLFTREGDVVIKASTPYDCVYIDKEHGNLLVTSFGFILRPLDSSTIDMRYLAIYLGLEQTNKELQSMSKGMAIQLIKKKDISGLLVPVPSRGVQKRLAGLFELTQKQKALCREIVDKSDLLLQSEFACRVMDR